MKLTLDAGPWVVGTLSSWDGNIPLAGDIVEVRLDKIGVTADWLERCQAIEKRGKPVLLTARLRMEGGEWAGDNQGRLEIYQRALASLSAVDIELRSVHCTAVARQAAKLGKVCIVSHHDFEETPPLAELESIVERARENGAVAKVATMIRSDSDVGILSALLSKRGKRPLCVIGMGEAWKQTRVTFPKLGSCLTYGYLDKPTAPGQWSAEELVRLVR